MGLFKKQLRKASGRPVKVKRKAPAKKIATKKSTPTVYHKHYRVGR